MIIITGMMRSGTSLTSRLLDNLGVEFKAPNGFFEPDKWNPEGYYESKDIIDMNSLLLTGFKRTSGGLSAVLNRFRYLLPFGDIGIGYRAKKYKDKMIEIAKQHKGSVVKDPRFCLTIKYWEQVTDIEKVVVCLRNPKSVVRSIWKSKRLPAIIGYSFWNRHIKNLIRDIPYNKTIFIYFENLQSKSCLKELEDIMSFLGFDPSKKELRKIYNNVYESELVHHNHEEVKLPKRIEQTWQKLNNLAKKSRKKLHLE